MRTSIHGVGAASRSFRRRRCIEWDRMVRPYDVLFVGGVGQRRDCTQVDVQRFTSSKCDSVPSPRLSACTVHISPPAPSTAPPEAPSHAATRMMDFDAGAAPWGVLPSPDYHVITSTPYVPRGRQYFPDPLQPHCWQFSAAGVVGVNMSNAWRNTLDDLDGPDDPFFGECGTKISYTLRVGPRSSIVRWSC